MSELNSEERACQWYLDLVDEVKRTGRAFTEDEFQHVAVHLNICPIHQGSEPKPMTMEDIIAENKRRREAKSKDPS